MNDRQSEPANPPSDSALKKAALISKTSALYYLIL
jgi:hypothetical protein